MDCEDALAALGPLLSDALEPDTERRLLEHLATCPACQAEADRLRDLWRRLGELPVEPPDGARMRQRFQLAVESFQTGMDQERVQWLEHHAGAPRRPEPPPRPVATIAWLAGLAAAALIGVFVGRELPARAMAPSADIVALRQQLQETREMVTLALLRQSSATERLRGVTWTERIDEPGTDVVAALLDALAHDPNVNVRLAAIDALTRYADLPGVRSGAVAALSAAAPPLVQVALIDLLVQVREPSSRDALRRLADDAAADIAVRGRAVRALQELG
jgi:hypothetical protein